MDDPKGPTVQPVALCSVLGRQPGWEGSLEENGYMYIYMAQSLPCSPETITTLLISCTPIQNKMLKKLKNKMGNQPAHVWDLY